MHILEETIRNGMERSLLITLHGNCFGVKQFRRRVEILQEWFLERFSRMEGR